METIIEATSQTKLGRPRRTGPLPHDDSYANAKAWLWQATKTAAATGVFATDVLDPAHVGREALAARARKKKKAACRKERARRGWSPEP